MNEIELRINNLIQLYRKPEDKQKTIHKVKQIGDGLVMLEDGFLVNSEKGIESIPITKEWFDDNLNNEESGWEFVGFGSRIIIRHIEFISIKLELNAQNQVVVYFNDNIINVKNYVHKLQNLYFDLTDKELIE